MELKTKEKATSKVALAYIFQYRNFLDQEPETQNQNSHGSC